MARINHKKKKKPKAKISMFKKLLKVTPQFKKDLAAEDSKLRLQITQLRKKKESDKRFIGVNGRVLTCKQCGTERRIKTQDMHLASLCELHAALAKRERLKMKQRIRRALAKKKAA